MISNSKAYVEQRKPFEKFRNCIAFSPRSIVAENTPCAFSRTSIGRFRNLAFLFYSRTAKVFLTILRSLPPRSPNLGALCPFHPTPTTSTSVEGSSHEDSSLFSSVLTLALLFLKGNWPQARTGTGTAVLASSHFPFRSSEGRARTEEKRIAQHKDHVYL